MVTPLPEYYSNRILNLNYFQNTLPQLSVSGSGWKTNIEKNKMFYLDECNNVLSALKYESI